MTLQGTCVEEEEEKKLTLDDVNLATFEPNIKTDSEELYNVIIPPATGTYSTVIKGILRVLDDGSHWCQGRWAVTQYHFTNSLPCSFNFHLDAHHAQYEMSKTEQDAAIGSTSEDVQQFPLDSSLYTGSFQIKKSIGYETIIDDQIVMKFKKNKSGSFNVYGKGVNAVGEFNILGTLVLSSTNVCGEVELYRIYKP
jgi:hypothetical protein